MPLQLTRPLEIFGVARDFAAVRFRISVRFHAISLISQVVEWFIAHEALVWARSVFLLLMWGIQQRGVVLKVELLDLQATTAAPAFVQ